MKKNNIRSLIIFIAFFSVSNFVVHISMNPEDTIVGNIAYAIFSGIIFGTAFYLIARNTKFLDK